MKRSFSVENSILSGQLSSNYDIVDISKLITQYYALSPDPNNDEHKVIFGTSGHRGSSSRYNFNEAHVLAISQSIVKIRRQYGITGPCYIGKDTHALSEVAFISVLEVLAANFVDVIINNNYEYTPTPVISHAIVQHNKLHNCNSKADGIIITASHNPPEDGGIKYNAVFGGPASVSITRAIEQESNKLLINDLNDVNRVSLSHAWNSGYIHMQDFMENYVKNLSHIINMQAIKASGLKLKVDPLGGASIQCWQNIAQHYQLDLTLTNEKIDKTFKFMHLDYDGRIRMDCSSELAIMGILKSNYNIDLLLVNDPDGDRYGIITNLGLMKPHDYLAIVIHYLFHHRPLWRNRILSIGKTYVSSIVINRIAYYLKYPLLETPVGFKWFAQGLFNSYLSIAGEESAGASFLDFYCTPWTTDKDGFIMCLLAAEIVAVTNKSLQSNCDQLETILGTSSYDRVQLTINNMQKSLISNTLFNYTNITELAGNPIIKIINIEPLNHNIFLNGIKIITQHGWVAGRLSGTEQIYKIYCESFIDHIHRKKIEQEIIKYLYMMLNNH